MDSEGFAFKHDEDGIPVLPEYNDKLVALAKSGDAVAQYQLAMCYMVDDMGEEESNVVSMPGVPDGLTKAFGLMKKSADSGFSDALYELGLFYLSGAGVGKDMLKAVDCLERAAEDEVPDAQRDLAILYIEGEGVKKDIEKAFKLMKAAAAQDDSEAIFELGMMYVEGEVPAPGKDDMKKGLDLIRKSSEMGNIQAMKQMGFLLLDVKQENGKPDKALQLEGGILLMVAASAGDEEAEELLETMITEVTKNGGKLDSMAEVYQRAYDRAEELTEEYGCNVVEEVYGPVFKPMLKAKKKK